MNYFTVLTQVGLQKLANATAQNKPLKLTHMVVGDGNGIEITPDDTMNSLHNEVFRLPIAELKKHDTNSNWIEAAGYIPAQDGDFWVREVGLLDDQGHLIAMGNYPQTFKPTVENGVANDMHLKMILEVSNTENISFLVDPAFEIANKEYVKESIANRKPAIETITSNVMIHADDVSINNTQEVLAFDAIAYTGQTTSDGFVTETGILEKGQTYWNDTGSVQTIRTRKENSSEIINIDVANEELFINLGVGSIDFTKVNNGTGFYHDRDNDGVVKNDRGEVIESGNITLHERYIIDINIKRTSQISNWARFDGLRGVGKRLKTDLTDPELLEIDSLTQFKSTGVCFNEALNTQNSKFISYVTVYTHIRWKSDFIEAYNPITGETIIIYKGDGVSGRVLSATNSLDYLQIKRLTGNNRWQVRTSFMNGNEYLELDSTNAIATANPRFTHLEAGNLTLTSSAATNTANATYMLYGKANSITQQVLAYTGKGDTPNFIKTLDINGAERRPRRVIVKQLNSIRDWVVYDSARTIGHELYVNLNNAEYTPVKRMTFHQNGFTASPFGGTVTNNAQGGEYLAIVEFDTYANDGGSYFNKTLFNAQKVLGFDAITYTGQTTTNGFNIETGILEKGQTYWNDTESVQNITVRNSNGIDTSIIEVAPAQQFVHTGVGSIDFTKVTNGTGFYHDRTEGDGIVKNDAGEVVQSGSIALNHNAFIAKVHIKSLVDTDSTDNNAIFDGLRGRGYRIYTDRNEAEKTTALNEFIAGYSSSGISLDTNALVNQSQRNYIVYMNIYTHIRWGVSNQNKRYIEAYNPITKETMIIYEGSTQANHRIPHSLNTYLDYYETKNLKEAEDWSVNINEQKELRLNSINAIASNTNNSMGTDECIVLGTNVRTNASTMILYGKAKSQNWTIVNYTGTGSTGNFIETKDIYGLSKKPARIITKRLDSTSSWNMYDNVRGEDRFLQLENSNAQGADNWANWTLSGLITTGAENNALGGQYIALVEFQTYEDGGSYFDKPLNQSKLEINNGVFTYTNGVGETGFLRESETFSGDIDFIGVSDGQKWIAKELDGGFKFYDKKPSLGLYEKENAQDNRVVFDIKKGKFFETIGEDLIIDGGFSEGISQWNSDLVALLTYDNGSLKIDRNHSSGQSFPQAYTQLNCEQGVRYIVKFEVRENYSVDSSQSTHIRLDDVNTGQILMNQSGYGVGEHQIEFMATHTNMRLGFGTTSNGSSQDQYSIIQYVSVYKKEVSLENIVSKPISFLRTPIFVINETPQLIEKKNELSVNVMENFDVQDSSNNQMTISAKLVFQGKSPIYEVVNENFVGVTRTAKGRYIATVDSTINMHKASVIVQGNDNAYSTGNPVLATITKIIGHDIYIESNHNSETQDTDIGYVSIFIVGGQ